MTGVAPRLSRRATLFVLLAASLLACLHGSSPARAAAAANNWAANDSADFDGDHLTDFGGVYRGRSPQDALWYALGSRPGGGPFQIYFGATTDVPVPGDYNGDGKTDAAIFRPSTGLWYGPGTGLPQIVIQMYLGQQGDIPVPGDYDGDGKTDPAIYRPSTGLLFAVLSGGGTLGTMLAPGVVPVARDYDGDGKTDPAVYTPGAGTWQAQLSGGGAYTATNGQAGDVPVPGDYNGDGRADPVVFRPSSGLWTGPYNGATGTYSKTLGQTGDVPIPGYYDSDTKVDPAVYRPGPGTWLATLSAGGSKRLDGLGINGDVPVQKRPDLSAPPVATAGLHVVGNQILDGNGRVVQFHGVNRSGPEYACIQGWGIFDGPSDDASVTAIKSWNSNIVHIGLNEDCILGINGVAAAYAGANYMNAIVAYVNKLHAQGLYAEVSLMWAAPGTQKALDHPAILDADHSPAALKAIANAFKSDPNTIIGLQSEPHAITWACWRNGGSSCSGLGYTALGMQGALDAVRSTGATNIVTASGIDYANNLSQWLANEPTDPLNQLIAEAHVYGGNTCSSTSCFNSNYAPVAASVPLQFGETGETYDGSSCGSTNINTFMSWADAHGVGYQAWVWETWGNCSSLISNYNGTAANAYATAVKSHYATRP